MRNQRHTKVIWIGGKNVLECNRLGEALRAEGLDLEVHEGAGDLRSALHDGARLVVVFCGNSTEAEGVFEALRSQYRPIPIVVLTSHPSCGDYYRLSWAGPTYFCTHIDESGPIQRAIHRAVARAA